MVLVFDGLCEPKNPGGYGCWGFVLFIGTKNRFDGYGCLGNPESMTNNFAEYCALGFGLKKILDLNLSDIHSLTILGDSQLVINQMNGDWAMKSDTLRPLKERCIEYLDKMKVQWVARWIPRDLNSIADELSRKGYREYTGKDLTDKK